MDKAWLEQKIKECESIRPEIEKLLREKLPLTDQEMDKVFEDLENIYRTVDFYLYALCAKHLEDDYEDDTYKWIKESGVIELFYKYRNKNHLRRYLDMKMEFDGDIIITDPCYIMREKNELTENGWAVCDYGDNMEALGITHYMTRDTLYGDWSCTTFDTDTKEVIGEFCADAGLVSVFLLDEVLKYNPYYKDHLKNKRTVTWIKDFKGTVEFVVKHIEGYYEEDTDYWKKGDYWEDYVLEVVGHGINKVTGKPINFVGKQTGL